MGFKPIDDRQILQRAALSASIGSAANTTLDSLFSQIDSVMVNLTGTQTLTNKTLGFLKTNVITDSTTTGSAATLLAGDIADGTVRLTNVSLVSISGIVAGLSGQYITLENQTGSTVIVNNDDSGASVGNRIFTGTGVDISMPINSTTILVYDPVVSHWMMAGTIGAVSAVIAPTRYHGSTTNITSGTPTIVWSTKDFDNDNALNPATGIYTAQIAGTYQINTDLNVTGTFSSGQGSTIAIVKNGSNYSSFTAYVYESGTSSADSILADLVALAVNDTIQITTHNDASGGDAVINSGYFAIAMIGN